MKKKTSAVAIVVAVIFSIILFPFIFFGGISSGLIFSLESMVAPNREEEIYQSFVNNKGMDWVYDLLLEGAEGQVNDRELEATDLFPKAQVETMVDEIYHAIIKGEKYQADFSYQKNKVREFARKEFEENLESEIENHIQEEYGIEYDTFDEIRKQEVMTEAVEEVERIFESELDTLIEEEFGALEKEISAEINSIYETPEYQELKALEAEYGYSLTDRTELCAAIRLGGYILLGMTAVFLLVLLLCHLFRPSGFFTAGAFTLVIGGLMLAIAKGMPGVLLSLISSELSAEFSATELPGFIMPMIEEVLSWCTVGFEKVGKIGLMAAVILILVGILLLVIRRNKAEAEPVSAVEM